MLLISSKLLWLRGFNLNYLYLNFVWLFNVYNFWVEFNFLIFRSFLRFCMV